LLRQTSGIDVKTSKTRGSKWADLTAGIEQARLAGADGGLAIAGMRD